MVRDLPLLVAGDCEFGKDKSMVGFFVIVEVHMLFMSDEFAY